MGDLTPNLSVKEFACKCKDPGCKYKQAAHMPLVLMIQDAADYDPITISTARGTPRTDQLPGP